MSKNNQNNGLSRRQESVLLALLETPSISHAAKSAGVSRNTIYKYLDDANFHREYRKRRRESFSQATALLNKAASVAVSELVKMILSPTTADTPKVAACRAILQYNESSLDAEVTSYDAEQLAAELERQKRGEYE